MGFRKKLAVMMIARLKMSVLLQKFLIDRAVNDPEPLNGSFHACNIYVLCVSFIIGFRIVCLDHQILNTWMGLLAPVFGLLKRNRGSAWGSQDFMLLYWVYAQMLPVMIQSTFPEV
uniref:Uncharacterized protein LOC107618964 n=1 Tax=Rhizophora mucronata TaxID=61149 RepID=A0A2P2MCB8_RHIMU